MLKLLIPNGDNFKILARVVVNINKVVDIFFAIKTFMNKLMSF